MNAITILACIIAGGGFLCFLIWVKLIGEASKLRNLKRFRSKNAGVADLLNYATMVDDGIIACKSGALMAAWVYTGKDNAQKTEAELNQTSDLLNRALLDASRRQCSPRGTPLSRTEPLPFSRSCVRSRR